jgi:type II secretory ATPase GspE/PulE/Tfp pilus assembly ATPase PilB-like protein
MTTAAGQATSEPVDFRAVELDVDDLESLSPEQAVAALLDYASRIAASDLYIVTDENSVSVAVRHLGIVRSVANVSTAVGRRWMLHIKALSGIRHEWKNRPNEGRWIRDHADGRKTDLRICTIPTLYGEDFALRLLERDSQLRSLDGLGMLQHQLTEMRAMLAAPGGLILVTGPTASGKTTTLYAALQHLNDGMRKINTIEDPIEYAVEGIRQSQINPALKLDFPDLLRHVLRQAPDVIMIGEVRDPTTAQTAVRAAGSGHLVLATLHAPTAATAIQSMMNLEVHPRFFADSLRGIVAQRLVRTLCEQCKAAFDLSEAPHTFADVERWLKPGEGRQFFSSRGCAACGQSGFQRRTGVFELLGITAPIRKLVGDAMPARLIVQQADAEGMINFRQAALLKVAQGLTSIEEVMRVVPPEQLGVE